MNKKLLRKKILSKRKKFSTKIITFNPKKLIKIFKQNKIGKKVIGGYYPYNYEANILEILKFLEKNNYQISLPKIGKNYQMNFYKWSFKEPLSINKYGIPEPVNKKILHPNIFLVPLVAFDEKLNRLGYGGGFYDRYLKKISKKKKVLKIGIAYSIQKLKNIPVNDYDMKLDNVITEKKVYS